jgi:hypothetical protein
MIRSNTTNSVEESLADVLAMLQDDKAGSLAEEAEFSLPDLVVGRSVRCLPNENARRLFVLLGACPEDALIPEAFVVLLWSSRNLCKSHLRLKLAAKKLSAMLVLSNLLNQTGKLLSMHDIPRDFSRGCIGNEQAPSTLQRPIMDTVVKCTPSQQEGSVVGNNKKLNEYLQANIAHHIAEALVLEGTDVDHDAVKWVQSSGDPFVGLIAVKTALHVGSTTLVAWSKKYQQTKKNNLLAAWLLASAAVVNLAGQGM